MSGSINIKVALEGADQLRRAIGLTIEKNKTATQRVIEKGTKAVAAKARVIAPQRSGELASTIRDEYSENKLTGFVKAGYGTLTRRSKSSSKEGKQRHAEKRAARRAKFKNATSSKQAQGSMQAGVYAPVVERGDKRRHKPAKPFMVPALRSERPGIISDLERVPVEAAKQGGMI